MPDRFAAGRAMLLAKFRIGSGAHAFDELRCRAKDMPANSG